MVLKNIYMLMRCPDYITSLGLSLELKTHTEEILKYLKIGITWVLTNQKRHQPMFYAGVLYMQLPNQN